MYEPNVDSSLIFCAASSRSNSYFWPNSIATIIDIDSALMETRHSAEFPEGPQSLLKELFLDFRYQFFAVRGF